MSRRGDGEADRDEGDPYQGVFRGECPFTNKEHEVGNIHSEVARAPKHNPVYRYKPVNGPERGGYRNGIRVWGEY